MFFAQYFYAKFVEKIRVIAVIPSETKIKIIQKFPQRKKRRRVLKDINSNIFTEGGNSEVYYLIYYYYTFSGAKADRRVGLANMAPPGYRNISLAY